MHEKTLVPEEVQHLRYLHDNDLPEFKRTVMRESARVLATLEEHAAEGTTEPMTECEAYRES